MPEVFESREYHKQVSSGKFDKNLLGVIQRKIQFLSNNPKHPSLHCEKLSGITSTLNGEELDVWSFKVNNKFRVSFMYRNNETEIILIDLSNHYDSRLKQKYSLQQ